MANRWQFIPESILEEDKNRTIAEEWGRQWRQRFAADWAQRKMRQAAEILPEDVRSLGPFATLTQPIRFGQPEVPSLAAAEIKRQEERLMGGPRAFETPEQGAETIRQQAGQTLSWADENIFGPMAQLATYPVSPKGLAGEPPPRTLEGVKEEWATRPETLPGSKEVIKALLPIPGPGELRSAARLGGMAVKGAREALPDIARVAKPLLSELARGEAGILGKEPSASRWLAQRMVDEPELKPTLTALERIKEKPPLLEQAPTPTVEPAVAATKGDITQLLDRYNAGQDRLNEIAERMDQLQTTVEAASMKGGAEGIARPPGMFIGWTDQDIIRFAKQEGVDYTNPDAWFGVDQKALAEARTTRRHTGGRTGEIEKANAELGALQGEMTGLQKEADALTVAMRRQMREPAWQAIEAPAAGAPKYPLPEPSKLAIPTETPRGRIPGKPPEWTPPPPNDAYGKLQEALKPDPTSISQRVHKVLRQFYDRQYDLGEIEKRSGVAAHQLGQIVSGAPIAGEADLERYVMPSLRRLKGSEPEQAGEWMALQRMRDEIAKQPSGYQLPGDLRGISDIQQAEAAIAKKVGAEGIERIKQFAQTFWAANTSVRLAGLKAEGVIDDELIRRLTTTHPHYVPFNRMDYVLEEEIARMMKPSPGSVAKSSIEFQAKYGSGMKLDDPLNHALSGFIRAKQIAWRNRAANAIKDGLMAIEAERGVNLTQMKGSLGLGEKDALISTLERGQTIQDTIKYGTVVSFRKGKPEYSVIPRVFADIAKGAEAEPAGAFTNFLKATTTPLRRGAVTYNPAWPVVNAVFLDGISGIYREGLIPFSPVWWKGMKAAATRNELWQRGAQEGALMSGLAEDIIGADALKRASRVRIGSVPVRDWKDALAVIPRLMERAAEISEQGSRLATLEMLTGQGVQWPGRAVRARDVSYDMSKAGNIMRTINGIIPFVNPGVQGAANTFRLMKDNPKQAALGFALLNFPSIMAYLNNARYETAADVPLYLWERSWPLIIGEGTEAPDPRYPNAPAEKFPLILRIPKPPTAAALTAPVELALHLAWKIDDRRATEYLLQAARTASVGALPFDPGLSGIMPPALETAVGVATGRDLYRNQPIVPQREQQRVPEWQLGPETSAVAVQIGQQFKVSPRLVDWAMKNYTAGSGQASLWVLDLALGALAIDTAAAPGEAKRQALTAPQQLSRTPVVSRFFSTASTGRQNVEWDRFNAAVEESKRLVAALPEMRRLGMDIGAVGETISLATGVPLRLELSERAALQKQTGETLAALAERMTERPLYAKLPDATKRKVLQTVFDKARESIRESFLRRMSKEELKRRAKESYPIAVGQ